MAPIGQADMKGHSWVSTNTGMCRSLCSKGVKCGKDVDGSDMYIGRAKHQGDLLPAKVIPNNSAAYVCWGGREISVYNFEMLVRSECKWVKSSNGNVPRGAFQIGRTATGETLYAGRVHAHGAITVGKVHPSHRCCYIPFNDLEERHTSYEVFVMD